jgi:hypothetical protein
MKVVHTFSIGLSLSDAYTYQNFRSNINKFIQQYNGFKSRQTNIPIWNTINTHDAVPWVPPLPYLTMCDTEE